MNANNTTIIKRDNPYKNASEKDARSGKQPGKMIRAWRSWDETTWLKKDQEHHK